MRPGQVRGPAAGGAASRTQRSSVRTARRRGPAATAHLHAYALQAAGASSEHIHAPCCAPRQRAPPLPLLQCRRRCLARGRLSHQEPADSGCGSNSSRRNSAQGLPAADVLMNANECRHRILHAAGKAGKPQLHACIKGGSTREGVCATLHFRDRPMKQRCWRLPVTTQPCKCRNACQDAAGHPTPVQTCKAHRRRHAAGRARARRRFTQALLLPPPLPHTAAALVPARAAASACSVKASTISFTRVHSALICASHCTRGSSRSLKWIRDATCGHG